MNGWAENRQTISEFLAPWANSAFDAHELWRRSGAMWLTGEADGAPLWGGSGAALLAATAARSIAESSRALTGTPLVLDGPALLGERGPHLDLRRRGRASCNQTSRLLRCADGWISFTMNRPDDAAMLSACFEADYVANTDPWEFVTAQVASRTAAEVLERTALVDLSCAALGEQRSLSGHLNRVPGVSTLRTRPLVVDLSSLWAGPLAANLLGHAGAEVVKVESEDRLDGARFGSKSFFDLLHGGHQSVTIDFTSAAGRDRLRSLVSRADVVLTSARPRAFERLGIEPLAMMNEFPITSWISITAFGPDQPNRIGYGDDAAVAAGLVVWTDHGPVYAADAIADPLAGLVSAAVALDSLATGSRVQANIALADVAFMAATATLEPPQAGSTDSEAHWPIERPRTRSHSGVAPMAGADNAKWLPS